MKTVTIKGVTCRNCGRPMGDIKIGIVDYRYEGTKLCENSSCKFTAFVKIHFRK